MPTLSKPSSPAWDHAMIAMNLASKRLIETRVKRGAKEYRRETHLPKLHIDPTLDGLTIISKLQNSLRACKNAIRAGHYASDWNVVIAIRIALLAERGYHT